MHRSRLQCVPWNGAHPVLASQEAKKPCKGSSLLQGGAAADHDQLGLGTGEGHIQPARVLQEAPCQVLSIAPDEGQDDAGLIPPLALVDGPCVHLTLALLSALPSQEAHLSQSAVHARSTCTSVLRQTACYPDDIQFRIPAAALPFFLYF